MAATKLNPAAPPFPCPYAAHHHHPGGVPPPPPVFQYHAGGACPPGSPVGAVYFYAQLPVPSPHHHGHPFVQLPVFHPSHQVLRKAAGPAPPARFLRKGGVHARVLRHKCGGVPPAKSARVLRKSVLGQPPSKALCGDCEGVPAQPADGDNLPEDVGEPAPHGLPPHKLMAATKLHAAAAAQVANDQVPAAQVAKDVATACRKAPAADQVPAARAARRKAERRERKRSSKYKEKEGRQGAVVGPRALRPTPRPSAPRTWAPPCSFTKRPWTTWTPPCKFTTERREPLPEKPPAFLDSCTTVMFRNIPNRLKGVEMIALLDEYCARANRAAGEVVAAYDVVYLPMDFRLEGNYGYAFVNFTTAGAAMELYYTFQGCGWKVCGSHKRIDIVPAMIQGKEMLVRHLSRHRFQCATEEYLPAVFTPPRDGGARATATTTTRVGRLLAGPPRPAPPPRFVNKKAYRAKVHQG